MTALVGSEALACAEHKAATRSVEAAQTEAESEEPLCWGCAKPIVMWDDELKMPVSVAARESCFKPSHLVYQFCSSTAYKVDSQTHPYQRSS